MKTLNEVRKALEGMEFPPDFDAVCQKAIEKIQSGRQEPQDFTIDEIMNAMRALRELDGN